MGYAIIEVAPFTNILLGVMRGWATEPGSSETENMPDVRPVGVGINLWMVEEDYLERVDRLDRFISLNNVDKMVYFVESDFNTAIGEQDTHPLTQEHALWIQQLIQVIIEATGEEVPTMTKSAQKRA
jgi:hypothetical protein